MSIAQGGEPSMSGFHFRLLVGYYKYEMEMKEKKNTLLPLSLSAQNFFNVNRQPMLCVEEKKR